MDLTLKEGADAELLCSQVDHEVSQKAWWLAERNEASGETVAYQGMDRTVDYLAKFINDEG